MVVGDYDRITIPALTGVGATGGRLRGLRCVHTVLGRGAVNEEDIMDLACLRLDLMGVLTVRDGLPDLPGLGGVGLPDEQRTARPITCPGCSFQPDPAAALMTPPPCCPHPCQTYRQRQPPARQHPAASPTPEGSDSPPNGIWL